jgi:hypothetical protein
MFRGIGVRQGYYYFLRARLALLLLAAGALASCGGGGGGGSGGVLSVNLSYGGNALLFRPSAVVATITGLDGHAPNCSLKSGTLPAGMRLNGDCSVTGTPVQAGSFPITVHLGADGVSNQLDWNVSILVFGPSVVYSVPSLLTAGANVSIPTLNNFWTATPADTVTYSVVGTLPPGLAIDAASGSITGTPTTAGSYQFKVQVQASNGGNVATQVQADDNLAQVNLPLIDYRQTAAWAGIPFTSTPTLPTGSTSYTFSAAALPPGLSLDAGTGAISGTPTAVSYVTSYPITVTATGAQGGGYTATTRLTLSVESPVYLYYPGQPGRTGVPYSELPTIINNYTNNHGGTLAVGYSYALNPSSSLLPGITLDPVTGEVHGTTAITQSLNFTVDVTVTVNGISFVVPALGTLSIQ